MIYIDNASTTKIDPEVLEEMLPYLAEEYGNPGTVYRLGRKAATAVGFARERVASLLNARSEQIIFTSGGSEANNLAIFGALRKLEEDGKRHLITSKAEHASVLAAFRAVSQRGFMTTFLFPNQEGGIDLRTLEPEVDKQYTGLVCLMKTNNETGAETSAEEIGTFCRDKGILFHTDCVQAVTCQRIDTADIACSSLSISSHKIHGPKGVGALFLREPELYQPIIYGGTAQEFGLRGGTENVAGIVGFGKACEILKLQLHDIEVHTSMCKQKFYTTLSAKLNDMNLDGILRINGAPPIRRGKILNLGFDGIDAETLILMLDSRGVCVSAGSACSEHEVHASHVLKAIGLSDEQAYSSVRFSFSRMNTLEEVQEAATICAQCVRALRHED